MRKNLSPKHINFQTKLNYIPYRELLHYQIHKSAHKTNRSNVSFNPYLTKYYNQPQKVQVVETKQEIQQKAEQNVEQNLHQNQAKQEKEENQNLFESRLEQQEPEKIIQNFVVLSGEETGKIQHSASQATTFQCQENKIIDSYDENQNRQPEPLVTEETETPFVEIEQNIQNNQNIEVQKIPEPTQQNNETDEILKRLEEECQNYVFEQQNPKQHSQISKQENFTTNKKQENFTTYKKQDSKKSMLSSQSKSENPEKRDKQIQRIRNSFLKGKPLPNPFAFKKPEQKVLKKVKSSENPFTKPFFGQKQLKNPFIKQNKLRGFKQEQKFFLQKCDSQMTSFQNSRCQSQANLQIQPKESLNLNFNKNKIVASMKNSKTKTPESNKSSKLLMRFKKIGTK